MGSREGDPSTSGEDRGSFSESERSQALWEEGLPTSGEWASLWLLEPLVLRGLGPEKVLRLVKSWDSALLEIPEGYRARASRISRWKKKRFGPEGVVRGDPRDLGPDFGLDLDPEPGASDFDLEIGTRGFTSEIFDLEWSSQFEGLRALERGAHSFRGRLESPGKGIETQDLIERMWPGIGERERLTLEEELRRKELQEWGLGGLVPELFWSSLIEPAGGFPGERDLARESRRGVGRDLRASPRCDGASKQDGTCGG